MPDSQKLNRFRVWRRAAAEGTTPGRKLPRVEDRCDAIRWLSPFRPAVIPHWPLPSSPPVPQHKISLRSLRVLVFAVRRPSRHAVDRRRAEHRALAAVRRHQPWSLPVAVSVGPRRLGKVVKRPSKRASDTRQPAGQVGERAEVTSGQQHYISAPIAISHPPPLVYCVYPVRRIFFF